MSEWQPLVPGNDDQGGTCIPVPLLLNVLRKLDHWFTPWTRAIPSGVSTVVGKPFKVASADPRRLGLILTPAQGMTAYWSTNPNVQVPSATSGIQSGNVIPLDGVYIFGPEAGGDIFVIVGQAAVNQTFVASGLYP
jgi:hypothetical protein